MLLVNMGEESKIGDINVFKQHLEDCEAVTIF